MHKRFALDGNSAERRSTGSVTLACLDRALACFLLLALSPLLLVVGLTIWILSGRSPLVAHRRMGLRGTSFWMLKFRSMWPSSGRPHKMGPWIERIESMTVSEVKPRHDPRVTSAFAAWCREHSVDELPQLWHAAAGDMSLVGPRPLTEFEVRVYYGQAGAPLLLSLRPGLSGLWQVRGRNALTYKQRRRLDLFLVRRYGWALYLQILLWTIPRLCTGRGAW